MRYSFYGKVFQCTYCRFIPPVSSDLASVFKPYSIIVLYSVQANNDYCYIFDGCADFDEFYSAVKYVYMVDNNKNKCGLMSGLARDGIPVYQHILRDKVYIFLQRRGVHGL